ncbi:hypothetical protein OY671_010121, partial [Metschnikowia pulcherrima]
SGRCGKSDPPDLHDEDRPRREISHRHRPLHCPARDRADAVGVRDRGVAACARQDAEAVRFRGDGRWSGQCRVQDAGQPPARIREPGDSAGPDAGHPVRLPQAGDQFRARRDARGGAVLHAAAARALYLRD